MYLLGLDIGSSSIKASLVDRISGEAILEVQHPEQELSISAKNPDWAEQNPDTWWKCVCIAIKNLIQLSNVNPEQIESIGIAYQMHGLVLVDKDLNLLRNSIIWCDSRAVQIGEEAYSNLGSDYCLTQLLNSPGNFTLSKLKWVQENQPELFSKIYKFMLPGDYIALKLSGELSTTISGLSEGIMWNFKTQSLAVDLFNYYKISTDLVPDIVDTFALQAKVNLKAASETGLKTGTPISYRAGDQPNNALSLGVFKVNEVAATGGTSGVLYGISDQLIFDGNTRINSFAHVNHSLKENKIGMLLCINGAGILYSWLKKQIARDDIHYKDMEKMIQSINVGSDGLRILPFGNGAERMLENSNNGAQINNLQFNRHGKEHLFRAAIEGIAFSFVYGFSLLKSLGVNPKLIKAGKGNLFQSKVFSATIANLIECPLELINTTGATGAAKASAIYLGDYNNLEDAFSHNTSKNIIYPSKNKEIYKNAFHLWKGDLEKQMTS